jgi:hypothetical protein
LKKKLKKISNEASLVLKLENNSMKVNSTFRLFNRFNFGMLLILVCSVFLIAISSYKATGSTLVFMLFLGSFFTILSVAGIVKQFTDFLLVTDKEIVFRNSFRKRTLPITPDLKVKTSIKRKFTNATRFMGSYSREVDVIIKLNKTKYRVLSFSMEDEPAGNAKYLSKAICRFIKSKIDDTIIRKG